MAGTVKKENKKDKAKKTVIRIICIVLAVSMVLGILYWLISFIMSLF
ncbi:MAG: hypothetical protein J6X19_05490 [Clostridia bacterium]|nr:hypothetical protein [Clostridia bacterium]MBP5730638.1 hypothetical protein [Clostridia bacterium]